MKSLLTLDSIGPEEVRGLISRSLEIKDVLTRRASIMQVMTDMTVANLFFEPSTRTRLSFDLAAKRLGAHVITLNPATSSTVKGESLRDTIMTVGAIGANVFVVRHSIDGTPEEIRNWIGAGVVNAGDGVHAHPTQALLDAATLTSRFGEIAGLSIGVVGDVSHSRVAASLSRLMPKLGAKVTYVAPPEMLPAHVPDPVIATSHLDDVLGDLDVVYLLRVQLERGAGIHEGYQSRYGMDQERSSRMSPDAVIMHPGPLNRGVEITSDLADGPRSLILDQVAHAVPTRMAVLEAISQAVV